MPKYSFESIQELVLKATEHQMPISRVVLEREIETTGADREAVRAKMRQNLQVMREAAEAGLKSTVKSPTGLVGGDARRVEQRRLSGQSLVGDTVSMAIARAMAVNEINAAMGRISASPTAGAAGTIPGVILTLGERLNCSDEQLVDALFTAGGIGLVIAGYASLSGAQGGCQAETGSAAAMAAAAAVELAGGTPEQSAQAAGIALKNMLGLVCDPIAGLVEAPCVKRNAQAAANALVAAELALAGVKSIIPPDEVIGAAHEIALEMPSSLRETAQGGLAATPTGKRLMREIFGGSQEK